MANYVLSCCSTADLSREHMLARDLKYVCFHYMLDGVSYADDLGVSMSSDDFYAAMTAGAETKTAQVSMSEYIDHFTPFLEEGRDILHVTLSSGLSGSYNSACLAAEELNEKYPDRKVIVVDSLAAASGYGLLMDKLADLRDSGMELEELAAWAEANRLKVHHWFFSTDLTFYIKGGRISKASGWFGTVLKICPLLNMDNNGKLIPRHKLRGKPAVIKAIVDKMLEHAENGIVYNGKCYICHSACPADALAVAKAVEDAFPKLDGKVLINNIGTTIGSHTGPGTVALFFWGDEREV